METLFVNATYKQPIKLDDPTLNLCKKYKTIALYASVQFLDLKNVIMQLEDLNINIISSKPDRTNQKYQILGCNIYEDNLNLKEKPDIFLYIGDGEFHPSALALATDKDIITFNPFTNQHKLITQDDVKKLKQRQQANLVKFFSSDIIGILITTKPGQSQLKQSKLLEEKYPDKQFYYFIDNNINLNTLEDFPFIESWINTACPRLGFEFKGVNLTTALRGKNS